MSASGALQMASDRAIRSCRPCKSKKRRCDKLLPSCGLCTRLGRGCHYDETTDDATPPTAADFVAMATRLRDLEQRLLSQGSSPQSDGRIDTNSPGLGLAGSGIASSIVSSSAFNSTSVGDSASLAAYSSADGLEGLHKEGSDMPLSLFLDFECFKRLLPHDMYIADADEELKDVLTFLSQGNMVVHTASQYFDTVHNWIPFISKKRMDLGIPLQKGGPDLALLFLAMRLTISTPAEVEEGKLYTLAKNFLMRLEARGAFSLLLLQAYILIALYEHIHSIYPAAWLSIGACARYAELLGISCHTEANSALNKPSSWTEIEERRRTWWVLYTLDRLSVTGNKRWTALPPPAQDGRLPGDDTAWNSGNPVTGGVGHAVSTSYHTRQTGFARLCQAAMYVDRGRAYANIKGNLSDADVTGIMSLVEELASFCTTVEEENTNAKNASNELVTSLHLLGPAYLARSALFLSLDRLACPESVEVGSGYLMDGRAKGAEESSVLGHAVEILQQVSDRIHQFARQLESQLESQPNEVEILINLSPFVLDSIYCAALTYYWLWVESGIEDYRVKASDLDAHLARIGARWKLGRTYSNLIRNYTPLFRPDI